MCKCSPHVGQFVLNLTFLFFIVRLTGLIVQCLDTVGLVTGNASGL